MEVFLYWFFGIFILCFFDWKDTFKNTKLQQIMKGTVMGFYNVKLLLTILKCCHFRNFDIVGTSWILPLTNFYTLNSGIYENSSMVNIDILDLVTDPSCICYYRDHVTGFFTSGFFMNHLSQHPLTFPLTLFQFFPKFWQIFTAQGAPSLLSLGWWQLVKMRHKVFQTVHV